MRAAVFNSHGPAHEVLRIEEIDVPEPGPGEVRVRIAASGVNPTDWKSRSGATPRPMGDFQIPHHDGAGVIDAVGAGVDPSREGQRVWVWLAAAGRPWGTAAQWSVVPADQAVPLPDDVSFELAARAGADLVVNYKDPGAVEQIRAFAPLDRIVELALGANLELDLAVSGPQTHIVDYAAEANDPVLPVRACMTANVTLRFVLLYGVPRPALLQGAADITRALADGALTELPATRFALEEVAAAHDAVQAGTIGKVLVIP